MYRLYEAMLHYGAPRRVPCDSVSPGSWPSRFSPGLCLSSQSRPSLSHPGRSRSIYPRLCQFRQSRPSLARVSSESRPSQSSDPFRVRFVRVSSEFAWPESFSSESRSSRSRARLDRTTPLLRASLSSFSPLSSPFLYHSSPCPPMPFAGPVRLARGEMRGGGCTALRPPVPGRGKNPLLRPAAALLYDSESESKRLGRTL